MDIYEMSLKKQLFCSICLAILRDYLRNLQHNIWVLKNGTTTQKQQKNGLNLPSVV